MKTQHRFSHLTPKNTQHFLSQIAAKGLNPRDVVATWHNPDEVYASRSHPGQWRITGNGLCLVGKPEGDQFIMITVYLDRVFTAPRDDQQDAAAQDYRRRWESGNL